MSLPQSRERQPSKRRRRRKRATTTKIAKNAVETRTGIVAAAAAIATTKTEVETNEIGRTRTPIRALVADTTINRGTANRDTITDRAQIKIDRRPIIRAMKRRATGMKRGVTKMKRGVTKMKRGVTKMKRGVTKMKRKVIGMKRGVTKRDHRRSTRIDIDITMRRRGRERSRRVVERKTRNLLLIIAIEIKAGVGTRIGKEIGGIGIGRIRDRTTRRTRRKRKIRAIFVAL